jgi:hypothetical protein
VCDCLADEQLDRCGAECLLDVLHRGWNVAMVERQGSPVPGTCALVTGWLPLRQQYLANSAARLACLCAKGLMLLGKAVATDQATTGGAGDTCKTAGSALDFTACKESYCLLLTHLNVSVEKAQRPL